ncbi:MAG TPA: tRNA pseudouridine(55) synthase TruB [Chlamydiales bacterium]|nr:tRNA pseudouridine(55) synthase TruB [Chlamydiales bacterium]
MSFEGILLVDKPAGMTSFDVVHRLRRRTGVQTIGHGGTLDPFATGVLVMLVGRAYTKTASQFLHDDKEYQAVLQLGIATDSHDCDGKETARSSVIPTQEDIEKVLTRFQGKVQQTPPMFSAKKINGKRLYELARKGKEVERAPVEVTMTTTLIRYEYPELELHVACSKGTYIRTIAHDVGTILGSYAYVKALRRLRSGKYTIDQCTPLDKLLSLEFPIENYFLRVNHAHIS